MGELSQNLLILTDFPFSYSLIGLLVLIYGQGANLEEPSFAKMGPLLILMGFVATTLSICDPMGTIQRLIIGGHWLSTVRGGPQVLRDFKIFGRSVEYHFPKSLHICHCIFT